MSFSSNTLQAKISPIPWTGMSATSGKNYSGWNLSPTCLGQEFFQIWKFIVALFFYEKYTGWKPLYWNFKIRNTSKSETYKWNKKSWIFRCCRLQILELRCSVYYVSEKSLLHPVWAPKRLVWGTSPDWDAQSTCVLRSTGHASWGGVSTDVGCWAPVSYISSGWVWFVPAFIPFW